MECNICLDELTGTPKTVVASTKVDNERGRLTPKLSVSLSRSHSPLLRIPLMPSTSFHRLSLMTAALAEYLTLAIVFSPRP